MKYRISNGSQKLHTFLKKVYQNRLELLKPPIAGNCSLADRVYISSHDTIYVNRSAGEIALVPFGVVTLTSTVPPARAGDLIVIWVLEFTVRLVPAVVPNLTAVAPVNPVPVMETVVTPNAGP